MIQNDIERLIDYIDNKLVEDSITNLIDKHIHREDDFVDERQEAYCKGYCDAMTELVSKLHRLRDMNNPKSVDNSFKYTLIKIDSIHDYKGKAESISSSLELLINRPYSEVKEFIETNYESDWESDFVYNYRLGNNIYLRLDGNRGNPLNSGNRIKYLKNILDSVIERNLNSKTYIDIVSYKDGNRILSLVVNDTFNDVAYIMSKLKYFDLETFGHNDTDFDYKLHKEVYANINREEDVEENEKSKYLEVPIKELKRRIIEAIEEYNKSVKKLRR